MIIYLFIFFLSSGFIPEDHNSVASESYMVTKVNEIREEGCRCGRKYMKPAPPIIWNETLEKSARSHAKEMSRYEFFSHYSKDGRDIGQRLIDHGYRWQVAGENIGEGQKTFDEVLVDWIKSKSHCKMLMDPRVTEMGVSKIDKYWVQHFGKPLYSR